MATPQSPLPATSPPPPTSDHEDHTDHADLPDPSEAWHTRELQAENTYVTALYDRLEAQRELAATRLRETHLSDKGGTYQARMDRETLETHYTRRLSDLYAAEHGLCFGRIDNAGGERQYVGRIALADEDHDPLLTDWRAAAAEPFYRATPAAPGTVAGRRHLRTRGRTVVDFEDDAFGVDTSEHPRDAAELSGESALLASLTAARTGRMGDIVSTIQAEQDRVIRSELGGVLVVQGGPGTGKTVVALHRAAYLLYTHRERLAKHGVLVIGPNKTFLRYIDQVLPALGESEVVLGSIATLYPGVTATDTESPEAAAVKGDARMAAVLATALADFRQLPETSWTITVGRTSPYPEEIELSRALCERAQAAALKSTEPHNPARADLIERLSSELALRIARDQDRRLNLDEVANLADAIVREPDFQAVVTELWPLLTPEQLLTTLLTSPERLASSMPDFTESQRAALLRPHDHDHTPPWTTADVPLLDEAAELLGPLPRSAATHRAEAAAEAEAKAKEVEFASLVMEDFGEGLFDAALLARQYRGAHVLRPLAERAAEDRTWGYGHIIVDEAQDLSPMAWRLLTRHCPGRSMTIVGDLAQTGAPAGLTAWSEALDTYTAGRWRTVELTVNYRTPVEIMQISESVLHAIDPILTTPTAVRTSGIRPWSQRFPTTATATTPDALLTAVTQEIQTQATTKMAIIHAPTCSPTLLKALAALDGVTPAGDPAALDSPVVLLTAAQSKGLEFDAVLVIEPADILTAHARGVNDLYVALTRATKTLGVLHTQDLPPMLNALTPR